VDKSDGFGDYRSNERESLETGATKRPDGGLSPSTLDFDQIPYVDTSALNGHGPGSVTSRQAHNHLECDLNRLTCTTTLAPAKASGWVIRHE